jgi:hypothetical protein
MIDQVGEKKWLRRKLSNFPAILFIVCRSALRTGKRSHRAGEKKSCNGRQPNSPQPIPLTQDSTRSSHHRLTFMFVLAPNRPLHHVTGRSQQTFQPF